MMLHKKYIELSQHDSPKDFLWGYQSTNGVKELARLCDYILSRRHVFPKAEKAVFWAIDEFEIEY